MKYLIFKAILFFAVSTGLGGTIFAHAMESSAFILPYAAPESFVLVQGYDSPPTHIKKDAYALDFSQNGCDAYGKQAVASASGKVTLAQPIGYNGGYGAQILIDHGDHVVTRYAHLVAGSIVVHENDIVPQGRAIGDIGNTGLVAGNACNNHPGTHLHFAKYEKKEDGTYAALMPEPISEYKSLTAGSWYQGNVALAHHDGTVLFLPEPAISRVFESQIDEMILKGGVVAGAHGSGLDTTTITPVFVLPVPTSTITILSSTLMTVSTGGISPTFPGVIMPPSGGVSISSGGGGTNSIVADFSQNAVPLITPSSTIIVGDASSTPNGTPSSTPDITPSSTPPLLLPPLAPPAPLWGTGSMAVFTTSTFMIDVTWQSPVNASGGVIYGVFETTSTLFMVIATDSVPLWTGTSTSFSYPIMPDGATYALAVTARDEGGATSVATTTLIVPNWLAVAQPYDGDVSYSSWYDDTWYQLGTGFYGMIRSLTLNGSVNNPDYFASHLVLNEFLDANYTLKNQSFFISDLAPFSATSTLATVCDLHIPLQPNKYYRLDAWNDYQNRSVVLRGTAATGTSMSNAWIAGVGRVENHYPFYPYLAWTFIPNWPPLMAPNPPPDLSISLNVADLALEVMWGATTDLDTTSTLLTYEYAMATSTDNFMWQSVGKNLSAHIPISFPNIYQVAVRARDDLGNVSESASKVWHFPDGFFPLPSQTNYGTTVTGAREKFHLYGPAAISGVALWTSRGVGPYGVGFDYAAIYADANGMSGNLLATSDRTQASWPREMWHEFSEPLTLPTGDYWLGPVPGPDQYNGAYLYGNANGQMYFRLK